MVTVRPATRALQKQARRDAVVAAAETLIRRRGDTAFSMLELADLAGLSPATPYNLFGGKSAILYALLNRSADDIFAAATIPGRHAIDQVVGAAEALAEVLAGDPAFYRPLYAYLMGVADAAWRPDFMARAHEYWSSALVGEGRLLAGIPPSVIADLLVTQALGCVELWVHGDVGDAELPVELRRSTGIVLLGALEAPDRTRLLALVGAPRSLRIVSRSLNE